LAVKLFAEGRIKVKGRKVFIESQREDAVITNPQHSKI